MVRGIRRAEVEQPERQEENERGVCKLEKIVP